MRNMLALAGFLLLLRVNADATTSSTYRVGVVELKPVDYAGTDRQTMLKSAELVDQYAQQAKEMEVELLVFPEYGITTFQVGNGTNRESLKEAAQDIPDPEVVQWNPCTEPDRYHDTLVLTKLSCSARENSVVLLVNLLTQEPCDQHPQAQCPSDGFFLFNTNLVFDKHGTLIARYHKFHRYREDILDPAPQPEYVIVDVGFVKFATFICYDIFYEEPAVRLVTEKGIRNLIFSTAWINELPYFTSPQLFSQFAHGLGANLIVSNMYFPEVTRLGSGVYSSNGILNQTWDLATPGKLVIADVPVDPPVTPVETITCPPFTGEFTLNGDVNYAVTDLSKVGSVLTNKPSSNPNQNQTHKIYYEPLGAYSTIQLNDTVGGTELCQGLLCCKLSYSFENYDQNDVYVLVARSGRRTFGAYTIGIQSCSVLRCESSDVESCGRVPLKETKSRFNHLGMEGTFSSQTVFPDVFGADLNVLSTDQWKFEKNLCDEPSSPDAVGKRSIAKLEVDQLLETPLMVYTLYARIYEWDL